MEQKKTMRNKSLLQGHVEVGETPYKPALSRHCRWIVIRKIAQLALSMRNLTICQASSISVVMCVAKHEVLLSHNHSLFSDKNHSILSRRSRPIFFKVTFAWCELCWREFFHPFFDIPSRNLLRTSGNSFHRRELWNSISLLFLMSPIAKVWVSLKKPPKSANTFTITFARASNAPPVAVFSCSVVFSRSFSSWSTPTPTSWANSRCKFWHCCPSHFYHSTIRSRWTCSWLQFRRETSLDCACTFLSSEKFPMGVLISSKNWKVVCPE